MTIYQYHHWTNKYKAQKEDRVLYLVALSILKSLMLTQTRGCIGMQAIRICQVAESSSTMEICK